MADYIERENLLSEIRNNKLMAREPAAKRIIGIIELLPAADVRPERHGEWLYVTEDGEDAFYECSECGGFSNNCTNPFCWKCGAKMDGKDGENDKKVGI